MSLAFACYFIVVLAIGGVAWWQTRDLADYILGGRRLGPMAAALSAGASDMSGWLLLGLPGYAYVSGLESVWLALALLLGSYCNWLWVAPRLRQRSAELGGALTLPEYFSRCTNGGGNALRWTCGVMIIIFYLIYTASGFVAGAKLFESVYGIDYHRALLIGGLAIVAYTVVGGFLAVVWTDVLQSLLMLVALLWLPITLFGEVDTPTSQWKLLAVVPRDGVGAIAWVTIFSSLAWGLGYFGQPHILARFMAIKQPSRIPAARRIAVVWSGLCLLGAMAVGWGGAQLDGPALADAETVFMHLVTTLFHPVIAGLLLAAILAAIMSTADSQLLVASSVLAEDFCKPVLGRGLSDSSSLWLGRLSVLGLAAAALYMAWDPDAAVLDMVAYAWAGFGASIGPPLLLSLFYPGVRSSTLLLGMLAGGLTVIIWRSASGGWLELYEMIPGVVVAAVTMLVWELLAHAVAPTVTRDQMQEKT